MQLYCAQLTGDWCHQAIKYLCNTTNSKQQLFVIIRFNTAGKYINRVNSIWQIFKINMVLNFCRKWKYISVSTKNPKRYFGAILLTCGVHYFAFPSSVWFPGDGYSLVLAAFLTFLMSWLVAFASLSHSVWGSVSVFPVLFLMLSFWSAKQINSYLYLEEFTTHVAKWDLKQYLYLYDGQLFKNTLLHIMQMSFLKAKDRSILNAKKKNKLFAPALHNFRFYMKNSSKIWVLRKITLKLGGSFPTSADIFTVILSSKYL